MKINSILTFIFILLMSTAYYLDNIQTPANEAMKQLHQQILHFRISDVEMIELNNLTLTKEERWKISTLSIAANQKAIGEYLNRLLNIHALKELEYKDRIKYFSNTSAKINLKIGPEKFQYILGDVSKVTGNFYFEDVQRKKIYLAFDTSFFEGIYRDEVELQIRKYMEIRAQSLSEGIHFAHLNVASYLPDQAYEKLQVQNDSGRFKIDLIAGNSRPAPPNGIKIYPQKDIIKYYFSQAKVYQVYDDLKHSYSKKHSKIILDETEMLLYKEFDNKPFFVLHLPKKHLLLILGKDDHILSILNVKHFWDLSLNLGQELSKVNQFSFEFSRNREDRISLQVQDITSFKVQIEKNLNLTPKQTSFNFLFHVLFGLKDFARANEIIETSEMKNVKNKITVEIFGKEIQLIFLKGKLLVQNLTDKYTLVYGFDIEQVGIKGFEDFFENIR